MPRTGQRQERFASAVEQAEGTLSGTVARKGCPVPAETAQSTPPPSRRLLWPGCKANPKKTSMAKVIHNAFKVQERYMQKEKDLLQHWNDLKNEYPKGHQQIMDFKRSDLTRKTRTDDDL